MIEIAVSVETKYCPHCQCERPATEFYSCKGNYDGLSTYCIEGQKLAGAANRRKARDEIIAALGGRCVTCGLDEVAILQVDHIEPCGSAGRPKGQAGLRREVLAHPEKFQLLCPNCHARKIILNRERARGVLNPQRKVIALRNRAPMTSGCKPMFTAVDVERMRDLKTAGKSQREIGIAFGCSTETVRLYLTGKRRVS